VLLTIVFGVLLAVVGITATAQAVMVSVYASTSTLNAIVESDVATLRGFLQQGLDIRILDESDPPPGVVTRLEGLISTLTSKGELLRVELRRPDGRILASNDGGLSGTLVSPSADFTAAAVDAAVKVTIVDADVADAGPGSLGSPMVLREFLPLRQGGRVVLVVGIWRDAVPILSGLSDLRRDVVLVTLTAALIATAVLYFVFRSAQARLSRQAAALVDASRRDALTGTLNHGVLVALLADDVEAARRDERMLGVALVDIDGFRLLNDNHGHKAGDQALLTVAELLRRSLPDDVVMGRYGPDEFLLLSPRGGAERLAPIVEQLRADLAAVAMRFEESEQLPLTISSGLCTYPTHGASVTTLLSTAVSTLEEAKAAGGDAMWMANDERDDDEAATSSFDVLKGLVLAVDTKDRYTKRHSEDVARYAAFLAACIGLDEDFIRSVRISGLLHDVGKIGIPDLILRKPSRLTADEAAVIHQHVALGDMIVRELPDLDNVRAGIRHHHERWDGRGYLAALAGEDIPMIARILAVADAFSAMTTNRPYRKGLGTREAIRRLGDAAGTQLEESLVKAFIDGLENAPDAPLPGSETTPSGLWTPLRRAA